MTATMTEFRLVKTSTARIQAFLYALGELSKEHGLTLDATCCLRVEDARFRQQADARSRPGHRVLACDHEIERVGKFGYRVSAVHPEAEEVEWS